MMTFKAHPKRKRDLIVIGVLACVAVLLYFNTFDVPWQFDDRPNIVDNPSVHFHTFSFNRLQGLVVDSYSGSTRFLAYFTFALNFYFGKLNVFDYHLVNLLIHIATGLLVFWFILLTLSLPSQKGRYDSIGFKVAFLTGLIFVAHPVQTQAVTYIVQRMTSMAAMFYLLSMVLYIQGRLSKGRRQVLYYAGVGISGLLSMLSKESAYALPIFIAFYEILFFKQWGERSFGRSAVKILLLVAGLGFIGFLLLGGKYADIIREGYRYRDFTMPERVLTQLRVVLHYLTLLVYPHPSRLNLDYDFPISKSLFAPFSTFFSLAAILLFIGIGIWKIKKWPVLSFFIFWYFGNLLIESSVIPLEMVYEHRLYLPSVGPFLLFCLLLVRGWEKWAPFQESRKEAVFAGLAVVLLFPLSWATIERNSVWRSEFQLWADCLKKSPHKARPHYNLGYYYYKGEQLDKAVREFESAVTLDPRMAPAHFNLGVIDYQKGNLDKAIDRFEKSIALDPKYTRAYLYLEEIYWSRGKNREALSLLEKALQINPRNARILHSRGLIHMKEGNLERAQLDFEEAVKSDPNQVEARVNLAELYLRKGMVDPALEKIQQALALSPDDKDACTVFGMILLRKGMVNEAVSAFLRAHELDPNDIVVLTNLGVAYRYQGKIDEAASQFKKVVALRPDDGEGHANLGEAYLAKDKLEEAIAESQRALQLNPNSLMARLVLGEARFKQGRLDQAIAEWEKVLEVYPMEARAHHNLAAAYYTKKEYRLALKHLDEASALGFKVNPQLSERLRPYR